MRHQSRTRLPPLFLLFSSQPLSSSSLSFTLVAGHGGLPAKHILFHYTLMAHSCRIASGGISETKCVEGRLDESNRTVRAQQGQLCRRQSLEIIRRLAESEAKQMRMCLFEVGKLSKIQLLDIFCEAIDPSLCSLRDLDEKLQLPFIASPKSDVKPCSTKGGFISQVIQKVRELPRESLHHLLDKWALHMVGVHEISKKVIELQSMIKFSGDLTLKERRTENIHRPSVIRKGVPSLNDEGATLLCCMFRFLVPIETVPYHEILCFTDVPALKSVKYAI
ncbi:hypothetical protein AXF42_Ash005145 [Apostasia shenzhenica]|uniref:Uncharacterized protein n=1 Tax=Apostasia shenzhenica TaxID=1088818 RepID=A0A2I0B8L3_9ASPA|nr:hypothetical protein AXF42_Ash005145 [Apostasia shenzhenica]